MGCRSVRLLGCCTLLVLGYMMHDYCGGRVRLGPPSVASPEPEPVPRDSECRRSVGLPALEMVS
jgi:hypothetical protein